MELIMEQFKSDYEKYQNAQKKVHELKGFYIHLIWFIFGMSFMIFINLKYSPQYLWFFWSLAGWGIGLFFHAMKVFNYIPFLGKNWQEQKIKQLMEKDSKPKYE